jgi:MATE family multidrug resistance protein
MTDRMTNASSDSMLGAAREVARVALPLMVSAGTFSLVLFADRTLLLWYDGKSMSASMAGGNLFWVVVCLPVGIASMTGAIISQYVGSDEEDQIGRFLWQSVWLSLFSVPLFALIASQAPWLFQASGQDPALIPLQATYLRLLMLGAVGTVVETALSGFFSGTERTNVIMWVSVASGMLNFLLDLLLIFGWGPIPAMGIAGAAIGSVVSFWFKAACYGTLLLQARYDARYKIRSGFGFDASILGNLMYFGVPAGLMFLTEAGGFTVIMLRIGSIGDVPLRATTMAINFNMVAFIPLVGVSIATSVLVGRHLLESGPARASRSVYSALAIGAIYSGTWLVGYLAIPEIMLSLYAWNGTDGASAEAIVLAKGLLKFVAIYVVLDAVQLILAGALRGAGDTWFVLIGSASASTLALTIGFLGEPSQDALHWWWWIVAFWIWLLAALMVARFAHGKWKKMRMV